MKNISKNRRLDIGRKMNRMTNMDFANILLSEDPEAELIKTLDITDKDEAELIRKTMMKLMSDPRVKDFIETNSITLN